MIYWDWIWSIWWNISWSRISGSKSKGRRSPGWFSIYNIWMSTILII